MKVRILTLFDEEPLEVEASVKKTKHPAKVSPKVEDAKEVYKLEPTLELQESKEKPIAEKKSTTKSTKQETDEASEKKYFSIGETAQKFKVRISHIRFWTVQFGLKVRTNRKGDRLYTNENIEQLKLIYYLVKEQGHTIAGAKLKLKELKNAKPEELQKNSIILTLKNLQSTLLQLRNQIQQL